MNKEISNDTIAIKVSKNSIIVNIILSLGKMLAGIFGKSKAMISDAIHSLSDVFSTIIVIIGIRISAKNSDKDHPYGHEKFECVASIVLAFSLFITGIVLCTTGISNVINKSYYKTPTLLALIIALISIAVKEAMFWYTIYYAKEINSTALKADAWHHRSDALSSIGSFIGILLSMIGIKIGDALACAFISIFVMKASVDIFIDAINKVVDKSCDEDTIQKITNTILGNKDVLKIDDLKTRLSGNKVYVDVEISVDSDLSLEDAHDIAEDIHNRVETKYKIVKHCMVHVNPLRKEE